MADEDERWLYGDSNPDEDDQDKETITTEAAENTNCEASNFLKSILRFFFF